MPTALDKARAALVGLKNTLDAVERDEKGLLPLRDMEDVTLLLKMADVQAQVSQAESLEKIAQSISDVASGRREVKVVSYEPY